MRGVYLTYIPSSDGQRKLVPRLEAHVILPEMTEYDVMVQVKACGLCKIDTKTYMELMPSAEQIPVGTEVSGVVTKVGTAVRSVSIGQEVAGILPLDTECPGCAEYCIIPEYCLVRKPLSVSHVDCAASLTAGLRAYTALHFQTHLRPGSTTLICSATSASGLIMIQMCEALGAKVIAAVSSIEEATLLNKLHPSLLRVIDLSSSQSLVEVCLQETGGLGVNCIIDHGVSTNYFLSDFLIESVPLKQQLEKETHRYEYEASPSSPLTPTKHQLTSCLAAQGQWVTSQPDLQLDPPESQLLHMKGASLHFLFEPVWTLSGAKMGDYLSILSNVMAKLEAGVLKPYVYKTVILDQVCEELLRLDMGKVVMRAETQR